MDVSLYGSFLSIRTPFSPAHDLIQIFSGVKGGTITQNCPVDFHAAGLQRKGHADIWHIDTMLAYCTDETSCLFIDSEDIGANHSFPYGVQAEVPNHDKTYADIGSLWKDDSGLSWTLVRIDTPNRLTFVSDNIGPSHKKYRFADAIQGSLSYISDGAHPAPMTIVSQNGHLQLARANRSIRCFIASVAN